MTQGSDSGTRWGHGIILRFILLPRYILPFTLIKGKVSFSHFLGTVWVWLFKFIILGIENEFLILPEGATLNITIRISRLHDGMR